MSKRSRLIRSIAVDDDGVFYIAINRKIGTLVVAVALSVAIVLTTLSVIALSNTRRIAHQQQRRTESALGECQRVQILRDNLNSFEGTVYVFVDAAYKARLASYRASHLHVDLAAARAYRVLRASVQYIPPTDCGAAVGAPLTYEPPSPIPYPDAILRGDVHPPAITP